jgi:hypothetical protein
MSFSGSAEGGVSMENDRGLDNRHRDKSGEISRTVTRSSQRFGRPMGHHLRRASPMMRDFMRYLQNWTSHH